MYIVIEQEIIVLIYKSNKCTFFKHFQYHKWEIGS